MMKQMFELKKQIIMKAEGIMHSFGLLDVSKNSCCCIVCCKNRGGTVFL